MLISKKVSVVKYELVTKILNGISCSVKLSMEGCVHMFQRSINGNIRDLKSESRLKVEIKVKNRN